MTSGRKDADAVRRLPESHTRLTSKGQLVLPKRVRETLGWRQGTRLRVERLAGAVKLTAERDLGALIDELAGSLAHLDLLAARDADRRLEREREAHKQRRLAQRLKEAPGGGAHRGR